MATFSDLNAWELIGLIADGESDRGAILAAGEFLSVVLGELIAARVVEKRVGPNATPGSKPFLKDTHEFARRISAAWALGLLRPAERRNLSKIKMMRNMVGHAPMHVSFATEEIAKLCAKLEWPPGNLSPEEVGRNRFFEVVTYMVVTLVERIPQVPRASPWPPPVFPDLPPPPPPGEPLAGEPIWAVVLESQQNKREE
jgi:hypothetical protein